MILIQKERRFASTPAKFELYKYVKGEFRWRLIAFNGRIIANSDEGYGSKDGAKNGIESVKKNAVSTTIENKV